MPAVPGLSTQPVRTKSPEYDREVMSVRGASRASFAALTERLEAENITSAAVATRLGDELFAVVGLLDAEHGLRRALSDPGKPAAEKGAVAGALLRGKVTRRTEALVVAAAEARWASPGDMVDAIEQLAVEAMVLAAEADDTLDELEDGLFRFGRVVTGQPDLRAALADPSLPADRKQALDICAAVAARRREQLIAVVRSAVELSATQRRRLTEALAASYGHQVHLNVVIDPSVMGGISVQIGDELIDGTVVSRLAAVRRKLAG